MKKYIGLEEMSNVNCSSVLNVIRNCKEVSRKQISDITGLSWGGMTKSVNKLFENEYIVEEKSEQNSGGGRIPNVISVNKKKHFVIGLDINKSGFCAYVMNLCGDMLKEYFKETEFENSEELLAEILNFTRGIFEEFWEGEILAIGVAMQGILDVENGVSVRFPDCSDWKNVPVRQILEETFGVNVFVEHDPNCMLYASLEEEDCDSVLLFRIDKSIGMAASVKGRILSGNGIMEIAHQVVVPGGKPCKCGRQGCLEAYIKPCINHGQVQGEAISEMVGPLAVSIYNMARMFNSDVVILTGDLIKYRALFEKELVSKIQEFYREEKADIRFVDDTKSAVRGAALIAVQGAIDSIRI